MQVFGAHATMVSWSVMLAQVVSLVGGARAPVDTELALLDAVLEPVEAHVNGFRTALFDCAVHDALSAFVVGLDGSGRLGVAKFNEGLADWAACLGIVEEAAYFGFGYAGHDVA